MKQGKGRAHTKVREALVVTVRECQGVGGVSVTAETAIKQWPEQPLRSPGQTEDTFGSVHKGQCLHGRG